MLKDQARNEQGEKYIVLKAILEQISRKFTVQNKRILL